MSTVGTVDGKIGEQEQDMDKETDKKVKTRVEVDMFNWGPCVVRMKISTDFQKLLLIKLF